MNYITSATIRQRAIQNFNFDFLPDPRDDFEAFFKEAHLSAARTLIDRDTLSDNSLYEAAISHVAGNISIRSIAKAGPIGSYIVRTPWRNRASITTEAADHDDALFQATWECMLDDGIRHHPASDPTAFAEIYRRIAAVPENAQLANIDKYPFIIIETRDGLVERVLAGSNFSVIVRDLGNDEGQTEMTSVVVPHLARPT